jgi:hypothetical protein
MQNGIPPVDEQRMDLLEASFPAASGAAFSGAYAKAVRAGLTVVVSEQGQIYEVYPNGQRRLLKSIAPPSPAQPGQKFTIP